MDLRFIADRNLGRLAKWLRILGYDTLYDREDADENFLRKAAEDGRIALTRRRDLSGLSRQGDLVVVKADHVGTQISEVLEALSLEPDPDQRMTRCLNCNAPLVEVTKELVEGFVPAYVYETCHQFYRCLLCGRFFWPGTHPQHVEKYLKSRIPVRRP